MALLGRQGDRTGLASALLLALGSDGGVVERDFLLTNDYYAGKIKKLRSIAAEKGLDEATAAEFISAADGIDEKYLHMALDSVKREYGSVDNYLRYALNLSDAKRKALQDKFLRIK